MSILERIAWESDRLQARIDRSVERHPVAWIVATGILLVVVGLALREAL
ncbi:MAG: hypothetical protein Q4D79_00010 [Propionibacteriaceae bacterium]|nr:hypothetical protein [Propionibacteriaceae bacterium]